MFEDALRVLVIQFCTTLQISGRPACDALVRVGCHAVAWHRSVVNFTVCAWKHLAVLFVI